MAGKNAKIDCFVDCVSPYSYFAELYLFKNRKALESQGVSVEFHPVFLGGIMQASGNQPPGANKTRGAYMNLDRIRAMKYFGATDMLPPISFPQLSLTAQRCLCYVEANHPRAKFEAAMVECSKAVWVRREDISKPESISKAFSLVFDEAEVKRIVEAAGQQEWKAKLNANTKTAIDNGAYGAPWFLVTNKEGEVQRFFGSDRWNYIFDFLGLQFQELKLEEVSPSKL